MNTTPPSNNLGTVPSASASWPGGLWRADGALGRLGVVVAAAGCVGLAWWVGGRAGIPDRPGFGGSLLLQASPVFSVVVVALVSVLSVVIGTLVAGAIRGEAGLLCAAAALGTYSLRGGPVRFVLMRSNGSGVFWLLAIELLILSAVLGGSWLLLRILTGGRRADVPRGQPLPEDSVDVEPASRGAAAFGIQVVATTLLMAVLCQSDHKSQVLIALVVSSYLGALLAHGLAPARSAVWYWSAPLLVGAVGYAVAALTNGWTPIAETGGLLPPLGRPLPLDYAAAGPIGALMGLWTSRQWQLDEQADAGDGSVA